MAKKTKFPLKLKDDVEVRTLDELRENFDLEKVVGYFQDGRLLTWLNVRYYEDEAEQVEALDKSAGNIGEELCRIFGVEIEKGTLDSLDAESIKIRNERIARLKQHTDDKKVIDNVDCVAFNQEELGELLDNGVSEIYLCNGKFTIPIKQKNKKYIGIGKVEAVIKSKTPVDFESLGIMFENVNFDEAYKNITESSNLVAAESACRFCAIISALPPSYQHNRHLMFKFPEIEFGGEILFYENFYNDAFIFVRLDSSCPIGVGSKFILSFGKIELADGKILRIYDNSIDEDFDYRRECEYMKGKHSPAIPHAITHFETAARMGSKEAIEELIRIYENQGEKLNADYWKGVLENRPLQHINYENLFKGWISILPKI